MLILPTAAAQRRLVRGLLSSIRIHQFSLELEDVGAFYVVRQVTAKKRTHITQYRVSLGDTLPFRSNFLFFSSTSFPFCKDFLPEAAALRGCFGFLSVLGLGHHRNRFSLPAANFVRGPGVKSGPQCQAPCRWGTQPLRWTTRLLCFPGVLVGSRADFL